MTPEEKVLETRRYWREPRNTLPDDDAPLPELHPHHYEEMLGIDPIPYECGDRWFSAPSEPIDG